MNASALVGTLRTDCRDVFDKQFAEAATDRFWLPPELINLLVEHVLIDGTVAFLAGVASTVFLDWWQGCKKHLKKSLSNRAEDPTPAQISAATEILAGAGTRLMEELQRIPPLRPGAAEIAVAQEEIVTVLELYNFDNAQAGQIAGHVAHKLAKRLEDQSSD
jgi:hypothetical protein